MNKSKKIAIIIISTVALISTCVLYFKFHTKNLNLTFNNVKIEDFTVALNLKKTDEISKLFISEDDKNKYKNWYSNMKSGSESDLIYKKSEFKVINFIKGDSPNLKISVKSPDITTIVKDIYTKEGTLPSKEILSKEVLIALNSDNPPTFETTLTIPIFKQNNNTYYFAWNSETENLLSGNLSGTLDKLQDLKMEMINNTANKIQNKTKK